MSLMETSSGRYKCPKCGSNESFLGTAIVTSGSLGMVREIGDSGVFSGASLQRHSQITVRKCKVCGEMLGQQNYVKSPSELATERERERKGERRFNSFAVCCGAFVAVLLLGSVIFGIFGGTLSAVSALAKAAKTDHGLFLDMLKPFLALGGASAFVIGVWLLSAIVAEVTRPSVGALVAVTLYAAGVGGAIWYFSR